MERNLKEIENLIAENKKRIDKSIEELKEIRVRLEKENLIAKEKYSKYLD